MRERKQQMGADARKVLDLLEFIASLCPGLRVCQIINNAIPSSILEARDRDTYYIGDNELACYLQNYADNILKQSADSHTEHKEESDSGW